MTKQLECYHNLIQKPHASIYNLTLQAIEIKDQVNKIMSLYFDNDEWNEYFIVL